MEDDVVVEASVVEDENNRVGDRQFAKLMADVLSGVAAEDGDG